MTDNYTPVEYIQGYGTQYIDTGYKISSNTKIEAKLALEDTGVISAVGVRGSYNSFSIQQSNMNYIIRWRSGSSSNMQITTTIPCGSTPHIFEVDKTNAIIDGTVVGTTNSYSFTENYNLFLFAFSDAGSPLYNAKGKIYYYKIYNNGTLVRDFVPVRDSNGIICLYDNVEEKAYYFKPGNSITYAGTSNDYTPIEYIEATGKQWIDTGVKQEGFRAVLDIVPTAHDSFEAFIGTYGPLDNQRYYLRLQADNTLLTQFGGASGNNLITGPTLTVGTRYTIDAKLFNGSQYLKVNGTSYGTRSITSQSFPAATLCVPGTTSMYIPSTSYCKLYSLKLYDSGDNLIRDFIPALDKFNNPCLYDKVTERLYINGSSTPFVAGPVIGDTEEKTDTSNKVTKMYYGKTRVYKPVEYIESNGKAIILTGVVANSGTKMVADYQFLTNSGQFGCGNADDTQRFLIATSSTTIGGAIGTNVDVGFPSDTNKHTFILDAVNKIVQIDQTSAGASYSTFNSVYEIAFFCRWNQYATDALHQGRLYSAQIYQNGELVRDFVPVVDENNVACLYDRVNSKAYYSNGCEPLIAGNLTGGADIVGGSARKINRAYVGVNTTITPIDYLQSNSNGTVWINTGVVPNSNTKTIIEVSNFSTSSSYWQGAFGSRSASTSSDKYCFFSTGSNLYRSDYGAENLTFPSGLSLMSKTTITKDGNVTTIGGNVVTGTTATFEGTYPIFLFSVNQHGGTNNAAKSLRIHSCKIYQDGETLTRDYIPVLVDGTTYAMYDKVESKLYFNDGTGSFIGGSSVGEDFVLPLSKRVFKNLAETTPLSAVHVFHCEGSEDALKQYNNSSGVEQKATVGNFYTSLNGQSGFHTCVENLNIGSTNNQLKALTYSELITSSWGWTLHFWSYKNNFTISYGNENNPARQILFSNNGTYISIDIRSGSGYWSQGSESIGPRIQGGINVDIPNNTWTHYALVVTPKEANDDKIMRIFVNGKKIWQENITKDGNGRALEELSPSNKFYVSSQTITMDEVVLCNSALWTENFEPPLMPYDC